MRTNTFHYVYRNDAKDMWQLNMYYIYSSFAGTVNIVFTDAMLALLIAFATKVPGFVVCLIILGFVWFPLIHPLFIWSKSKKNAATIDFDTDIMLDDSGIHITVKDQHEDISWKKVTKALKKPTMMVIYTDAVHSYIITDRIVGKDKKAFRDFVMSKVF